jgi:hypothetical protein
MRLGIYDLFVVGVVRAKIHATLPRGDAAGHEGHRSRAQLVTRVRVG